MSIKKIPVSRIRISEIMKCEICGTLTKYRIRIDEPEYPMQPRKLVTICLKHEDLEILTYLNAQKYAEQLVGGFN